MALQRVELGAYDKIDAETYAECARITLSKRAEDGRYSACVVDGILYISQKTRMGDYAIVKVNSTFDLSLRP